MTYPGGKGKTFQHIINLIPPHDVYIETHLGGGAVMRNLKQSRERIGIDADPEVIQYWKRNHNELCTLILSRAEGFLLEYPYKGTEVVYCDPPYLPSTRKRKRVYKFDYDENKHRNLLDILLTLPCRVLISGYDSSLDVIGNKDLD